MCLWLKFVSRLPMKLATHQVIVLGGTGAARRVTQEWAILARYRHARSRNIVSYRLIVSLSVAA